MSFPATVPSAGPPNGFASLWELDSELQRLMLQASELEADGVELPAELLNDIQAYFEAAVAKIDRIAGFIKHTKLLESAKKEEKARLDTRARIENNQAERVKNLLLRFMEARGLWHIKGKLNTVSLHKNSSGELVIPDERAIPDMYRDTVVVFAADILQACLDAGEPKALMEYFKTRLRDHSQTTIDRARVKDAVSGGLTAEWITGPTPPEFDEAGEPVRYAPPRIDVGFHVRLT